MTAPDGSVAPHETTGTPRIDAFLRTLVAAFEAAFPERVRADFLEQLYRDAKLRWGYLVPDAREDRRRLRDLCGRMLGLENHFLRRSIDLLSDDCDSPST
jgi:hypothetical protein